MSKVKSVTISTSLVSCGESLGFSHTARGPRHDVLITAHLSWAAVNATTECPDRIQQSGMTSVRYVLTVPIQVDIAG